LDDDMPRRREDILFERCLGFAPNVRKCNRIADDIFDLSIERGEAWAERRLAEWAEAVERTSGWPRIRVARLRGWGEELDRVHLAWPPHARLPALHLALAPDREDLLRWRRCRACDRGAPQLPVDRQWVVLALHAWGDRPTAPSAGVRVVDACGLRSPSVDRRLWVYCPPGVGLGLCELGR